jgi:hypothetical protein
VNSLTEWRDTMRTLEQTLERDARLAIAREAIIQAALKLCDKRSDFSLDVFERTVATYRKLMEEV